MVAKKWLILSFLLFPQAPLNSRVSSGRLFLEGVGSLESVSVCVEWDSSEDFVYRCQLAGQEEGEEGEEEGYPLVCQESLEDTRFRPL